MDSPLDDQALAVLDDYCDALRQDDTEEGLTASSCPTDVNDVTRGFFPLLKELDDARRMLKEDSRAPFGEELLTRSEPPAIPEQFGRYLIRRLLGSGGMGAVYLAHDTQLERDVALKIPQFSRADDRATLERFQREARAAATLNHPNICPVFDSGEIEGVPYLTMAFIDGRPLACPTADGPAKGAQVDEAGGPAFPTASARANCAADREIVALIRKVALALDYAHSKGVVHRDLKPGNMMLDHRGEPIVVDFGLARRAQVTDITLTQPGVILGSLAYMSPEQALGEHERVGTASDIYSLGVILYELLTNRLPYRGRRSNVLGHIISSEPVEPAHELDPRLKRIFAKALAKPMEERFGSMAEFAAALQDYLDGNKKITGVTAAPASPLFQTLVRSVSAILLLIAVLGAVFGGFIVVTLRTKDGTLVVEVNEPGAKVTVLDEQGVVEVTRASDGGTLKLSVDPGKHRLKVEKDGFALFAKEFSIASGDTESIKATLTPPQAAASAASRPSNAGSVPAPPGLIAWWSGDGHAQDSVGGNHGVLHNETGFAPGVIGQAFKFDGIDDYIRVPNSDALNPKAEFTIEFWVWPELSGGFRNMISKWDVKTSDFSYVIQDTPTRRPSMALSEQGFQDLAKIQARLVIHPKTWLHLAATFDTSTVRLYLNGSLDSLTSVGSGRRIHQGDTDILIGAGRAITKDITQHFGGLIDEVKFYDRALSADEIRAIFISGSNPRRGLGRKDQAGERYAD